MDLRVWEDGESEGRTVMVRIGVEPTSNITPHESGQTSIRCLVTREFEKPTKEIRQMTAKAGAISHDAMNWHDIEWGKVHGEVRRLQARIVKATQEGRWGKVRSLQHLLTRSFSGKALAVKRVTENQGKNTPGVDGVIWDTPKKKMQAVHELNPRGYRPQPLRRVYIPKSNDRLRPLGIPTMKDRAMQAWFLLALDPVAETLADPNSFGFRKERCQADAIAQCFISLGRKHTAEWIMEGDIKACYDRISHQWLLENIPMEKTMLRKWLKAGYIEEHILYPTEEGVPQGGIISPVIANMALDGLEKFLRERLPKRRRGQKIKVNLVRFADDFIITGYSKACLAEIVRPLVEQFLHERGLELSAQKTTITHIQEGFDFLGQNIRKYGSKLLIKPSKKSIRSFLEKVRRLMKANPQAQAANLIRLLNPLIRGWVQYHRHVVSKAVFSYIDHCIFNIVWQWATRRHPNKSAQWIRKTYFHFHKGNNWTWSAKTTTLDGKQQRIYLFAASHVPIRRHIKIRGQANPYDPTWETYFEKRMDAKVVATLTGRKQLLNLWKSQQGICPVCSQKITTQTGWHSHHIIWRSKGGSDLARNRILLHPNCHQQVHNLNISVGKPRPALQGI
jgi:RNA-directed DNA polymerase